MREKKIGFLILFLLVISFYLKAPAYATDGPIYMNSFETEEGTLYDSDIAHGKVLYGKEEVIDLQSILYDKLTITLWVKPVKYEEGYSYLLALDENEIKSKGRYIGIQNNKQPIWVYGTGQGISKTSEVVLLDEWTFLAYVYDGTNKQARIIVNDTIYPKSGHGELKISKVLLNATNTMMDDVKVFDRILSFEELENMKGSLIKSNKKRYEIYKKENFVRPELPTVKELLEKLESQKELLQYKVVSTALVLEKRIDSEGEYIAKFRPGDIVTIKNVIPNLNKVFVETSEGKLGYLTVSNIKHDMISVHQNKRKTILHAYMNLIRGNNKLSTVIIYIGASLLIFIIILLFVRFLFHKNAIAMEGMMSPSIFLTIILSISSIIGKGYEINWFLHGGGWRYFPNGYTEIVHWFLFIALGTYIVMHFIMLIVTARECGIIKCILCVLGVLFCNLSVFYIINTSIQFFLNNFGIVGKFIYVLILVYGFGYLYANKFVVKAKYDYGRYKPYTEYQTNDNPYQGYQNAYSNEFDDTKKQYNNQNNYENNYENNYHKTNSGYEDKYSRERKEHTVNMPINYFAGVKNQEELKKRYRELLKIYHPDNQSGDNTETEKILKEYEYLKDTLS